jgi:hypothetical protein
MKYKMESMSLKRDGKREGFEDDGQEMMMNSIGE